MNQECLQQSQTFSRGPNEENTTFLHLEISNKISKLSGKS